MHTRVYLLLLLLGSLCISCSEEKKLTEDKAIVLGDSSTIVTETDSQYLKDFVADIKPLHKEEPAQDTVAVAQPVVNAAQPEQVQQPKEEERPATAPKEDNGVTIAFDEVTIFIPRIAVHEGRHAKNRNGATYQLREGELERNQIKVTSGNVQRISQRVQAVTTARTSMGELRLDALGNNTNWQPLRGKNNTYLIGSLSANAGRQTPATIRNAAMRAVRSKRMHRNVKQKWEAAAQHIHQRDVSTSVRSVIWKIEGKDARGRNYQKQIRVDL